jgi:hypothetical protein
MDLLGRFWTYTADTYGGMPALLALNLVQLSLFAWVLAEGSRAARDRRSRSLDPAAVRIRAARRAEIWQRHVRPLTMSLMLLGPGLGLGLSTLLGALGMGALGDAVGSQSSPELLQMTMARAYREISFAYFLMVGGTLPMLVGPLIVLAARKLEHGGTEARGGEPDDLMLRSLDRLVAVAEEGASKAERDAAATQALLRDVARALRSSRAA